MILISLIRIKQVSQRRILNIIMVSLTSIPLILVFGNILINESNELLYIDRFTILGLGIMFIALSALPIALMLERKNRHNQKLDPTVKTPVESGNVQGTAGQL